MNTVKNDDEELENYRQQRIKDFLWLANNLVEVDKVPPTTLTLILRDKLLEEFKEFFREGLIYAKNLQKK